VADAWENQPFKIADSAILENGAWFITEAEVWCLRGPSATNPNSAGGQRRPMTTRTGAFLIFFGQDHRDEPFHISSLATGPQKFYFRSEELRDRFKKVVAEQSEQDYALLSDWWPGSPAEFAEGRISEVHLFYTNRDYLREMQNDPFGASARALYRWASENCVKPVRLSDTALVFGCAEDAALFKLKFYRHEPPVEEELIPFDVPF
jgi:hypothetical protein